jgi:phosphate-selective porin OprO and OprP
MKAGWIVAVLVGLASPAAAQGQPTDQVPAPKPPVRFVWDDKPSIRAGVVRVDFHARLQSDFRQSDQDLEQVGGTYETEAKRLGVNGRITKRLEFEVESELRKDNPWKDVYLNGVVSPAFEVRGGKFKIPFGYEELTGKTKLDFAYRTLLSNLIAPARAIGVMAHGRVLDGTVKYEGGWFNHDGENATLREPTFLLPGESPPGTDHTIGARVSVEPLRRTSSPRELRRIHVGLAFTHTDVPEGLNSLRGKSLFGTKFFEPVYVLGSRRRLGTEAVWTPGPFSVKSEWARSNEQRKRQGLADDTLSDFLATGWYVSGTWLLTGERKDDSVEPRNPLFTKGFGAVEVGARYETIHFGSALTEGVPLDSSRGDPLLGNSEGIWTLGVNWYLNKWGKIVVNGIREAFEDPDRAALTGKKAGWSSVLRLQFAM